MELNTHLSEIYLRTMFDMVAQRPFEHLHWGLWEDLPEAVDSLAAAQQAYADRLVALIPQDVAYVVDVGCGLGGIARQVVDTGRAVLAITPRPDHHEALSAATDAFETRLGRFEDLSPEQPADLLLFAESFSFFDVNTVWRHIDHWLRPGGSLLIAELMTQDTVDQLRSRCTVEHDEDITKKVAFTTQVLQHHLDRHVRPYHRGLIEALRAVDATLAKRVEETLHTLPNAALRSLFAGRVVEDDMLRDRRYRFMRVRPQAQ